MDVTFELTDEQYQQFTVDAKNSLYEGGEPYALLELSNEGGELAGVIKKYVRDSKTIEETKYLVADEAGDTLWSYTKWLWFVKQSLDLKQGYNIKPLKTKKDLIDTTNTLTKDLYTQCYFLRGLQQILKWFGLALEEIKYSNYGKLVTRNSKNKEEPSFYAYTIYIDYKPRGDILIRKILRSNEWKVNKLTAKVAYKQLHNQILTILEENKDIKHNLKNTPITVEKTCYFLDCIATKNLSYTGDFFVGLPVDHFAYDLKVL